MKKYFTPALIILMLTCITGFIEKMDSNEEVPYPDGYRSWTHIKTGMLSPHHPNEKYRGFNHIYANDLALTGYTSGEFPEGSVIVVDIVEAVSADNHTSEGARRHMDVIHKDSVRFPSTGGWGYGQFEKDNAPRMLTLDEKKTCSNCHAKEKDHVFSEMRK